MRTNTAVAYFGGKAGLVLLLAIAGGGEAWRESADTSAERREVEGWGKYPPEIRQWQIEVLSGGALRAERRTPPRRGIQYRRVWG